MRRLASFALPYSAAVFLAQYVLPRRLWLPAGVLCALLALTALAVRGDRRLRALLAALGLCAGFLWCRGYDACFFAPAEELDGRTVVVRATVHDWPRATEYGYAAEVRVHPEGRPDVRALLYAGGAAAALKPGDSLSVIAACRLAGRTAGGAGVTYYTARGVYLLCTAYGEMTVAPAPNIPLRYWPRLAAKVLRERVEKQVPPDAAPLTAALITGDKAELDDSLYAALRRTGLAHVVAVSGLHISFLAGLFRVLPGRRHRRASAAAVIGTVFFFAAVTGNSPSALRAAFQCACLQAAPLLGREEDPPTALSAVLALLLLHNPRAAAHIGLQLSFAAVAGIYLFAPALYDRWTGRLPRGMRFAGALRCALGILSTTLGAMVLTTPLSAYYFGTVSLIAPLSNLLALPAVTAAFIAGLAAALTGIALPGVGSVLAWPAALPVFFLRRLVFALSKIPFAAVTLSSVYYALWLLFAYAVLCLCLFRRGKTRWFVPAGAVTAVLCAAVLFTRLTVTGGNLAVSVLDVGQGQSIVIHAGGYTALVDCGGNGPVNAGDVAADYLQGLGCGSLDLLVLTHFHADHVSGVEQLMERLAVCAVAMPEPEDDAGRHAETLARAEGAAIVPVAAVEKIPLSGAIITLYPPLGGAGENERGLSVVCSAGDFDLLITGDMSAPIEARLLRYAELPDIELLIAGHHGSKYSNSEQLLQQVTPELTVISVGSNSYGHPAEETLARFARSAVEIYRTDVHGTVTVTVP